MNREPFEGVVAEHGPRVLRVCRAMLGPEDAEDAWSETFLAALRAYPGLAPGSNVGGWLVTIAHNKAIDVMRRAGPAPRPVGVIEDRPAPAPEHPGVHDDELRRALDSLTPRQRAAVVYHHVGGLSYAEIGALLGSTETAARRSAADGIAHLRRTYRKDQP